MDKVTLTLTNNEYEVTNKAGNLVFKCNEPLEKEEVGIILDQRIIY